MRSEMHIVPDSPPATPSSDTTTAIAATHDPNRTTPTSTAREPFARFRRSRTDTPAQGYGQTAEDEIALKLQVMLLSEENARLKAAQNHPSDLGTLIDQMRQLGAQEGDGEALDEAWTMLSECLVIREGLEQACVEIHAAISDVRARLGGLAHRLDDVTPANRTHPNLRHAMQSP